MLHGNVAHICACSHKWQFTWTISKKSYTAWNDKQRTLRARPGRNLLFLWTPMSCTDLCLEKCINIIIYLFITFLVLHRIFESIIYIHVYILWAPLITKPESSPTLCYPTQNWFLYISINFYSVDSCPPPNHESVDNIIKSKTAQMI